MAVASVHGMMGPFIKALHATGVVPERLAKVLNVQPGIQEPDYLNFLRKSWEAQVSAYI